MDAADYFCGAGGASKGLHDAGYTVHGYDNWPTAVDTHRANGLPASVHDLSDPTLDHLLPTADTIDLAWFSCPCQPFSAAGNGDGEFDDRDGFPWMFRILERHRYPLVIVENVKGLTFTSHADYFASFLERFHRLGYRYQWRVLNCADYGVPQTRERCIIVARCDDGPITWPTVTHTETAGMFTAPWVTMGEALPHLANRLLTYHRGAGNIERHGESGPWNPNDIPAPTVHSNAAKDWQLVVANGCNTMKHSRDPQDMVPYERSLDLPAPTVDGKAAGAWTVGPRGHGRPPMSWIHDRPATTVNGDLRISAPGHHDPDVSGSQQADAIRCTIPELATLQGFPPDWQWCGTKTAQAKQVGNAVPPAFARAIATANTRTPIPQ